MKRTQDCGSVLPFSIHRAFCSRRSDMLLTGKSGTVHMKSISKLLHATVTAVILLAACAVGVGAADVTLIKNGTILTRGLCRAEPA